MNFESQKKMPYEIDLDKIIINKSYEISLLLDETSMIIRNNTEYIWTMQIYYLLMYIREYILQLIIFIILNYYFHKTIFKLIMIIVAIIIIILPNQTTEDYILLMLIFTNLAGNLFTKINIQHEYFHTIIIIHLIILIISFILYKIFPSLTPITHNTGNTKLKFDIYKTTCNRYGIILYTAEHAQHRHKCSIFFDTTNVPKNPSSMKDVKPCINGMYLNNLLYDHRQIDIEIEEMGDNLLSIIKCINLLDNVNVINIQHAIKDILGLMYCSTFTAIDRSGSNEKTLNESNIDKIITSATTNDPKKGYIQKPFEDFVGHKQNSTIIIDTDNQSHSLSNKLLIK